MDERGLHHLDGAHHTLRDALPSILDKMASIGHPMRIVSGRRSDEEQQALYAQGRTAPGKVVTQLDGVTKRSKHQVQADGTHHAVDVVFVGPSPHSVRWDGPWDSFGALVRQHKLVWGGDWRRFRDRPHVEVKG